MPFIANYKATLKCGQERKFKISLNTTEFVQSNYSRFKCHNKFYETRWCEGKNIGFINKNFTFYSKAEINFDKPFLVPGPRAPPFDKIDERWNGEPIIMKTLYNDTIPIIRGNSYVYGTFWNEQMLWHSIFDFIVPFLTFTKYFTKDNRENRTIFVHHYGDLEFSEYLQTIGEIKILERENDFLMEHCYVGIDKFEDNPYDNRPFDDSISFSYNFLRSDYNNLRNQTLLLNNVSLLGFGINNKPLVLIIDRNTSKRNITNQNEFYSTIKKIFNDCEVININLDHMHPRDQLYYFARCSFVIGVHGSGLTNVVFMNNYCSKRKTHLLEILPFNYSCRNWFNVACNYSGVRYHKIMSNQTIHEDYNTKNCRKYSYKCSTSSCHDILRDQDITVPIHEFEEILNEIHNEIKDSETFNEFGVVPIYRENDEIEEIDDDL